jgi:hypothetical protein
MARCGCSGTSCSCVVTGAGGVTVTGSGSEANPYVVTGGGALEVVDGTTVDLTLSGDGTIGSPFLLTAEASIAMGDITDFDDTSLAAGKVVAVNSGATGYELITAPTASPGVIVTTDALDGDGSVGSPLALLLDGGADSGLTQSSSGLKVIGSGPGIAYTPTWTASVSAPSVGDGTLLGRFIRMMNLCFLNIDLTIGASTGRGSGAWNFALPAGCDALSGVQQTIPLAITTPSGGGMSGHAILLGGTSTLNLYIGGATSTKITNSNPSSLPAGSRLSITGFYEVD